eukprot:2142381-Amphidinium_carterae.1
MSRTSTSKSKDNDSALVPQRRGSRRVSFVPPFEGSPTPFGADAEPGDDEEDDDGNVLIAQATRSLGSSATEAVLASALENAQYDRETPAGCEGDAGLEHPLSEEEQWPEDDGLPSYLQPPRTRSPEALERAKERQRMLREVSVRPDFGRKHAPAGRPNWNFRHQLSFSNAKLNPNYR